MELRPYCTGCTRIGNRVTVSHLLRSTPVLRPSRKKKKKRDENAVFLHRKVGLKNRNGELQILRLINERRRLSNKDQVEHLVRVSCRLIIFAIYVIDCPRIRGDLGANKDSLIRLKMCRRDPVDRETSET